MEFELLADSIKQINDKASSAAKSAVNQLMTLRNWAIGYYIVEYEQDGSDRAEYGSHLLKNLEKQIDQKGMNYTLFKACRQFYKVYPQIGSTVSSEFKLPDFGKSSTVSNEFVTDPDVLVNNLSFSHIREIMVLNDAFERFFYETECMKCNWNVRELRRQIKTNLYVRAGISKKPELLLKKSVDNANGTMLSIKDPFTFEFLGLDARDAVSESDLEQSSPNLCVNSSFSYVVLSTLLLYSRDLTEWSLVYHSTLSYQRFYDLHSIHYDHLEGLHQLI